MLKKELRIPVGALILTLSVVLVFAILYGYIEHYLLALTYPSTAPDTVSMYLETLHPLITELIIISCSVAVIGIAIALILGKVNSQVMNDEMIFSKALDAIPDSVGVAKLSDSTLMWINKGFTELTGYTKEEALGQSVVGLELWLDLKQRKQFIDDLKNKRSCNSFETTIQRKNGEHVQVLISGTIVQFNGVLCVFLMATNLSVRKQVENELILAEARYRNFIQHTNDAIVRYDCETPFSILAPLQEQKAALNNIVLKECNSVACEIFNYDSIDEIVGKRYYELVNIDDRYYSNMLDEYVSNNYKLEDYVYRIRSKNNHEIAYVSVCANGLIENGQHVRVWVTIKDITHRIHAEQALKTSEEKFSKAFHASGDAIVITSLKDGKIIDVNQGVYRTLGFRPDEIIGKTPLDFNIYVNPKDREEVFDRILNDGSITNMEIEVRKKTGEIIVALFSAEKINLENQACMISTFRDITHLHKAEKELIRYEKIVASITDSVVVTDDNFNYEYVNAQYLDFIGKSGLNVIGKNMEDIVGTKAFETVEPAMSNALAGATVTFERWSSIHTDKLICIEVTVTRFKDVNDGKWYLLSVGRDITERKQVEDALRQNERRYRSILEATKVIPWELNVERWTPTYIGPQIREQLGYEAEQWMHDEFWLTHIDPADRQEVDNFYRSIDREDTSGEVQYRIFDSEHNTKWIRDIVHPVTDKKGNRLLQGIMVDMTESKEKENQLSQAQKMEAVGRLTGGIAHDFNNLLTIIRGNISLLAQSFANKDSDIEEMLADALSASDDGAELTEQLLAFSSKQSLKPQSVEINNQIENTARLFRRMIGEDIDFNISLAKNNPITYIDPSKFDNALLNLMINARDAMESGGILSIKAGRETVTSFSKLKALNIKPGDYVTVTVTDNGCGMDPETIKQACEPFFTTKASDKGSGLGLSMVYGFVNQSNGGINISSQPGVGTSITLYMPEISTAGRTGDSNTEENNQVIADENAKETVLVTEDEARVRKFAVKCLQSLGYHVIEAHDAESAIAMLKDNKSIDVLFSDNILPGGMNGRELAGWALQNYPKIKIMLATGFSEHESSGPSVYDGRFPLLRKPYSKEDLAQQLHDLIQQEKPGYKDTIH